MDIQTLFDNGAISEIDLQFARLMSRCQGEDHDLVGMAAALASRAAAQGHVCLDVKRLMDTVREIGLEHGVAEDSIQTDPVQWMAALSDARVVGQPGQFKPMILDGMRLYLHRLWQYEQAVAKGIQQRCHIIPSHENDPHSHTTADAVARAFPEGDSQQQRAVLSALTQGFTVISGGPGTGKTYTIARLILILHQIHSESPPRIKLAAPTGKAAMRLQDTIEKALAKIDPQDAQSPSLVGEGVQTLHRLLGAMSRQGGFRFHENNPLRADMVIIDEASMIDLALMAALTAALPPLARLVLIGDKDQLASVEAGAVLGDICCGAQDPTEPADPSADGLSRHIIVLKQRYRFGTQSGIDALASAVNDGDPDTAIDLLTKGDRQDLGWKAIESAAQLEQALAELVTASLLPGFHTTDPLEAFARMAQLMILSPLRQGPFGVHNLNNTIERTLMVHGAIPRLRNTDHPWYPGRPVIIARNDYYNHLFNGDVGVAMASDRAGDATVSVHFPDGEGGHKTFTPQQLPPHDTAYALTVHKSQGSEFERVVLILPDQPTPVLSRELIYTAITRARGSVEIWGTKERLAQAIQQPVRRDSGLMDLLWQPANSPASI